MYTEFSQSTPPLKDLVRHDLLGFTHKPKSTNFTVRPETVAVLGCLASLTGLQHLSLRSCFFFTYQFPELTPKQMLHLILTTCRVTSSMIWTTELLEQILSSGTKFQCRGTDASNYLNHTYAIHYYYIYFILSLVHIFSYFMPFLAEHHGHTPTAQEL